MLGIIKEIKFMENDTVKKGDTVVVLESMKVLNELKSSVNGCIKKIYIEKGAQVGALELLVEIEPKED
jgi:biotin carboxyl carrier protein